jgi:hypothetical protein
MSHLNINDVRSEALFASCLQRSEHPTAAQVLEAIAVTVRRYGSRGCAARMAQEFGDAPDIAPARMCWARQVVTAVFAAELARHGAPLAVPSQPVLPTKPALPDQPARVPALASAGR